MSTIQKFAVVPAVAGALALGIALASYGSLAFADTGTTTQPQGQTQAGQFDPHKGGHVGKNGVKEEILTGDSAQKATAAALAAMPGGTVERVETDAEGAAYEAHMAKSDGSHVTLKFDANFNVTSTEDGPNGHGPRN